MPEVRPPVSFRGLIQECQRIEVPLIQRDYAQGRESQRDVRNDFLGALQDALSLPPGDPRLPLNLDFVYGSFEVGNVPRFLPLDGQQRLTTLFLLHWYLAWRDGLLAHFKDMLWDGRHSRFTYGVRPSSTEFFDALVGFVPSGGPDSVPSVRQMLEDQPWFFLHWRLDPTIQGVLTMLDAIHGRFRTSDGFYARLVDEAAPAITFHLLPLEHFGLSDDLYIKMNARGKPLTTFETFKARFEELLKELFPTGTRRIGDTEFPVPTFFERRMDTQWTDFFWNQEHETIDAAALNLIWALIRISIDPESPTFAADTAALGGRSLGAGFTLFHDRNWLTARFADHLMDLLEAWSAGGGAMSPQLPDTRYFNETALFRRAITEPWALTYFELVQFAAFVTYLTHHRGAVHHAELNQWMRVIRNLATNSDIQRPEEYGRSLVALQQLVPNGNRILERFADDIDVPGFSGLQVREEVLKARLIVANDGWRPRIESAEGHDYFAGQIGFLLDFCGANEQAGKLPAKWDEALHANVQASFDDYLIKAQTAFGVSGLATDGRHLWKRALLSVGDYLPSGGGNHSFLTNRQGNWDSWKRFLRGGTSGTREYLKILWDRIDAKADVEPQLEEIIAAATGLEPWRAAALRHPEVITYCRQQEIRRGRNDKKVYLLTKKQMSGYHAELFSYVLYLELAGAAAHNLSPLRLQSYQSVYMSDFEPHVLLVFERAGRRVSLAVESAGGQFRIHTPFGELQEVPEVESVLSGEATFVKDGVSLTRLVPRDEINDVLRQVALSLAKLPS